MLCTIPFPVDSYEDALRLKHELLEQDILVDTRGDRLGLTYADSQWYVVVSTGNIGGMVRDLESAGFLS